ncbi:acylphosphatase [Halobacteriovorax marinus]|nr:acylphosphatase [Halobacteriovorax marinus]
MMEKSFNVFGKVQGIMFRQTFIRSCHRRKLCAGASNSHENKQMVTCTVSGNEEEIDSLLNDLLNLEKLNSWGARVEKIQELDLVFDLDKHQVTTENVDSFKWSEGVEFYL